MKYNYENKCLTEAVKSGDLLKVCNLLKNGANPSAVDEHGKTNLHWPSSYKNIDIIKCLIDAGANIDFQSPYNKTPLHSASENGCLVAIKCLHEAGANYNAQDNDGETPLHLAVQYNHLDIIKYLLDAGANYKISNEYGKTPFELASFCERFEACKIFEHWKSNQQNKMLDSLIEVDNIEELDDQTINGLQSASRHRQRYSSL